MQALYIHNGASSFTHVLIVLAWMRKGCSLEKQRWAHSESCQPSRLLSVVFFEQGSCGGEACCVKDLCPLKDNLVYFSTWALFLLLYILFSLINITLVPMSHFNTPHMGKYAMVTSTGCQMCSRDLWLCTSIKVSVGVDVRWKPQHWLTLVILTTALSQFKGSDVSMFTEPCGGQGEVMTLHFLFLCVA